MPLIFALDLARGIPAIAVSVGGTVVAEAALAAPEGAADAGAVAGREDAGAADEDGAADAPPAGALDGAAEAPLGAVEGAGVGKFEPHAARIGSAASPAATSPLRCKNWRRLS